jgi:hypothetical protein
MHLKPGNWLDVDDTCLVKGVNGGGGGGGCLYAVGGGGGGNVFDMDKDMCIVIEIKLMKWAICRWYDDHIPYGCIIN